MSKSLLSGKKFNSNHQTYIPNAKAFLHGLKSLDSVKKIFLGEITTTKSGKQSAKIRKINEGMWEVTFRGVVSVQKFRVVGGSGRRSEEHTSELQSPD